MAHAEQCPLCWGKGKIQEPGSTAVDNKTCHGCGGKGWVSIEDAEALYPRSIYSDWVYPVDADSQTSDTCIDGDMSWLN